MNNKASPPPTDPTKKCKALFPYFPSLEGRLAGEHTVEVVPERDGKNNFWMRVDGSGFMSQELNVQEEDDFYCIPRFYFCSSQ
jgi:hypothetical protein